MVLEATQVIAQRAVFAKDLDERQRLLRYQKSLNYYRGKHENPFLDPDVNFITANYCRLTVDKGVAFLFGKEPIFEQDPFETTPMEETIRQIWHANKKMTLLKNIGLNGGIFGDVFVALRVGDGSLGKIKNTAIPMIENIDPALVTVEWDPRNFQHETSFVIEWEAKNILEDGTEESVIFRQEIQEVSPGSWVIRDLRKRSQDADFVLERRVEWPWKWPPILHWQNLPEPNAYYGDSDLTEDIFAIQDAINFTLSNIGVILKNHAHPKTIGIGFLEDIMRTGPSKMSIIEDPDAKVFNLEMISDLGSSVQFFKDLVTTWHEIARIPEAATGRLQDVQRLAASAIEMLYGSLMEKTQEKYGLYGDGIDILNRRLLEMVKMELERPLIIHWPRVLPRSPQEQAQADEIDLDRGLKSVDTAMRERGYNPDVERAKIQREAQGAQTPPEEDEEEE